jgi:hypothetical protein
MCVRPPGPYARTRSWQLNRPQTAPQLKKETKAAALYLQDLNSTGAQAPGFLVMAVTTLQLGEDASASFDAEACPQKPRPGATVVSGSPAASEIVALPDLSLSPATLSLSIRKIKRHLAGASFFGSKL